MFRAFTSFLNCCKKRKNDEGNASFSDGDYEQISTKKVKKQNNRIPHSGDIKDRIEIEGNLEYEKLILDKKDG
jgi:hypothetical protein